MPQGRGPGATTPAGTGRASGAGPQTAPTHRLIRVGGQAYEVPVETTDEEIRTVLGAPPDLHEGQADRRPGSSGSSLMDLITDIPSMVATGGVVKKFAEKPAMAAGKFMLRKAVPGMLRSEAERALERGAGGLLKSSIRKLADSPMTRRTMQAAMPGRMGGSVVPELALAGSGSMLGVPAAGTALAAAKLATRPLPLSLIAQGVASGGPTAAGAVGGLAQAALNRLLGGGQ